MLRRLSIFLNDSGVSALIIVYVLLQRGFGHDGHRVDTCVFFWQFGVVCSRHYYGNLAITKGDAVGDGRLRPWYRQLDETYASSSILAYSLHCVKHDVVQKKPDVPVHNILHCRQRINEPHVTYMHSENSVKFRCVAFEICQPTDRQTDRHTDTLITILCTLTGTK